jgi:hypothetical protein
MLLAERVWFENTINALSRRAQMISKRHREILEYRQLFGDVLGAGWISSDAD